jgi:metal-responsive CopG/Arc/MetJ family transcriptional regulator
MAQTRRITISLPKEILNQVDDFAHKEKLSRSSTIRKAIENLIKENEKRRVLGKAAKIYAEIAESDRKLSEEFLGIASETLSTFSPKKEAK